MNVKLVSRKINKVKQALGGKNPIGFYQANVSERDIHEIKASRKKENKNERMINSQPSRNFPLTVENEQNIKI